MTCGAASCARFNGWRYNLKVMPLIIRQAVRDDVAAICRLQERWLEEDSVYGFVPDNREQVEAALGAYFLLAEAGGEVIGFISGSTHMSEGTAVIAAGESYLEIDNLYVEATFRRQGVGGELVESLLARARENGVAHAVLYSAAREIHSVLKFYERHKFQSWYVQMFQKL
jgi:ribosomal protein S18 acetylase RimI-like enzyme